MIKKIIKNANFTLFLSDTSKSQDTVLYKELLPLVESALDVFSRHLLGKSGEWLKDQGIKSCNATLTLCGSQKIRTLNRDYRGKDKTTDVLSFPLNHSLRSGDCDPLFGDEVELGDIFISLPVARKQAIEFKVTLAQEIAHQLVHALLHLTGYDHEISETEEKLMFDLEEKMVKKIYKKMGY